MGVVPGVDIQPAGLHDLSPLPAITFAEAVARLDHEDHADDADNADREERCHDGLPGSR